MVAPASLENVVGSREFLQPETGLFAGIAELVVGGQYHQDIHKHVSFIQGERMRG